MYVRYEPVVLNKNKIIVIVILAVTKEKYGVEGHTTLIAKS